MSTIGSPIHCSSGRTARREVLRAGAIFLASPLFILAISLYDFDRMWVFACLGAVLVIVNSFFVGLIVWSHCRWLEFDGFYLRGQRLWPFGTFEYPVEEIREVTAQLAHYGKQPNANLVRFGKCAGVWVPRDMTNSAELLSAFQAVLANRKVAGAGPATTTAPA